MEMDVNFTCNTAGDGYWTKVNAAVKCIKLVLRQVDDDDGSLDDTFAELAVFTDWDGKVYGLIYTDTQFLTELRAALVELGFSDNAVNEIGYSEQGMQDVAMVSCDVGAAFIAEYTHMTAV